MKILEKDRIKKVEEEEAEEEQKLKTYRQELVHKPQPIRNFGRLPEKKKQNPITVPQTPKFELAKRAEKRKRKE